MGGWVSRPRKRVWRILIGLFRAPVKPNLRLSVWQN